AGRTPRCRASTTSSSRFAAPPSGGAATRTRRASPWTPTIPLREAPGTTHTWSRVPPAIGASHPSEGGMERARHAAGDLERQPVEALHQDDLRELNREDQDERREVDAAREHEGQAAADLVEDRLRHRIEEPDDRVSRVRVHPRQ